jgi:transcriptional regulator of arginine metabolism
MICGPAGALAGAAGFDLLRCWACRTIASIRSVAVTHTIIPLVVAGLNANGNADPVENERPLGKADRQKLVASLVERLRIGTQQELLEALNSAGCVVTQATVSRDIHELGLVKDRDALGTLRYVLPNSERRVDPRETLRALLGQFGRRAVAAENVVVLQSEIGSAPAIARALDRCGHPLLLGTLAGDDTCLAIAADAQGATALAAELNAAIG